MVVYRKSTVNAVAGGLSNIVCGPRRVGRPIATLGYRDRPSERTVPHSPDSVRDIPHRCVGLTLPTRRSLRGAESQERSVSLFLIP